ncbi:Thiopurine S-methyltransferase [Metarhizium album ARSEF 1941]|uniref:Thiopurine S-methyltransferase n=1 Tax=Metarhizium album (strain ARSEF 1941) TaxID=1081103 RepID=A0A0B2WDN9_METAS|nr:Thiopurine S-methyltransferase [Metarhizium album ARSEF 1941]KHN93991.1 Thiopurine S-methyltransferase [Metarhizium album ARSEF 1941]
MPKPASEPPGRLISHFTNRSRAQQSEGWDSLWESDENDLWDRAMPSPALIDFIESKHDHLHAPPGRRLCALVPGCGRGYDVAMLALHGFDVYGLEVSAKGAEIARDYATRELVEPHEYNFGSKDWPKGQPGRVRIIAGDFFVRNWEQTLAQDDVKGFDLIYDYTFLCALLPEMRKDWGRRMRELVAPTGILVCLEFPMYKDVKAVGPPWGLNGVYWNILAVGKDGLVEETEEDSEAENGPFKRVVYFKPPRSYEAGRGTDMLSVWKPQ